VSVHLIEIYLYLILTDNICRIIVANFKFSPAYSGQKAQPTAAVTMSRLIECRRDVLWLTLLRVSAEPADNLPLFIEPVEN
jgi:hypothetical protein